MPDTERIHCTGLDSDKAQLFTQRIVKAAGPQSIPQSITTQLNVFERLGNIIENINRVASAEQRLKALLYAALHDIPAAQQGAIYLATAQSSTFVIGAISPSEPDLEGADIEASGGYIDAVALVQYPVLLPDVQKEALNAYQSQTHKTPLVRSALVAPFVIGGRTVGVLSLENCEQTHAFTHKDLRYASMLSNYTAMTVDHARLSMSGPIRGHWQRPELSIYQNLAELMPVGLIILDEHQRYVWVNRAFCEMTGFTRQELRGELFHVHRPVGDIRDLVQRAGCEPQDLTLLRQDKTHCQVKAILLNLDAVGVQHIGGSIGIVQDLSTRVLLERQLFHLQRLSSVGTLASSIAHELNNPLTSVIGFAELILTREDIPCEAREDLAVIVRQAQRGMRVVYDLLDYVHLQSEEPAQIDINHLIHQLIRFHTRTLRTGDLDITLNLTDHLPSLLGDARQLQQVILNLINNAEQASASVGKEGKLWIRTSLVDRGRYVRISVRDDGPGIPWEAQPRIFEPFFTTKAPREGTGLGLSISKQIVEQHSGRIWFESEPGKGTVFFIDLPVTSPPKTKQHDETTIPAVQVNVPSARVLVVDDEKGFGHLLEQVLTKQGHQVDIIWDGNKAIRELQKTPYDIVFLDLNIPALPGQAVYAWIKRNRAELIKHTVILTSDTLSSETIAFLEQEHALRLLKPFQLAELRSALKQVWPEA